MYLFISWGFFTNNFKVHCTFMFLEFITTTIFIIFFLLYAYWFHMDATVVPSFKCCNPFLCFTNALHSTISLFVGHQQGHNPRTQRWTPLSQPEPCFTHVTLPYPTLPLIDARGWQPPPLLMPLFCFNPSPVQGPPCPKDTTVQTVLFLAPSRLLARWGGYNIQVCHYNSANQALSPVDVVFAR